MRAAERDAQPARRRVGLFRGGDEPLSAGAAVSWLAVLAALSTLVRLVLARELHGPFVFMDELGYQRMALSLARNGELALFGKVGLAYSPLYSVVLAPIYALSSTAAGADRWVQVVNALLMSLAVFPIYGIARFVLSRRLALGAAALCLAAPLMYYSAFRMSEALAYPLFLVAVWAMLRTVEQPGPRNDALLLGAILLAGAARLQQVALVPAALTAIVLAAGLAPTTESRLRSAGRALARHSLLVGVSAAVLVVAVARTVANGGSLPLAGRYANVGSARAGPLRVLELTVQHLAGLDLSVAVIPFAGALVAAYALGRSGFPRRPLVFASAALATTVWVLLEVGFDAAAFDGSGATGTATAALPRIHERYLIYLVPFFLTALVASLTLRRRPPAAVVAAAALVAALLPAAIPVGRDINNTIVADSFTLQLFSRRAGTLIVPVDHARSLAVVVSALLALVYLVAVLGRRPVFAVLATVAAFAVVAEQVRDHVVTAALASENVLPPERDWVDRAVGGQDVVLVGLGNLPQAASWQTAFYNFSIARVYSACGATFGADFGEQQVTAASDGTVRTGNEPVTAAFAVVPAELSLFGRVLAHDPGGDLVLVQPSGGILRVRPAARSPLDCG